MENKTREHDIILAYIKDVANTDSNSLSIDKMMEATRENMHQINDAIDNLSGKVTRAQMSHISAYLGDLSYCMLQLTFQNMLKHSNRPNALFSIKRLVEIASDWIEGEIKKGIGCDNCDNKH